MAILFLGIGSSGLHVLEEAQQFNYELTGQNKPKDIHYLYLESDLSNKPKKTPLGTNNITGVELSLDNMAFYINNLRNNNKIDSSWIPEATQALGTSGAGGKSSYGRLSLWANFTNVKNEILKLNSQYDGFKTVYVVGSVTGGTGSGLLIDIAYLLRQLIGDVKIFSLLMIPKNTDLDQNTSNFYLNSYYAIKSLEHYSLQGNEFKVTWPDGIPLPDSIGAMPPYDMNIIVSPDYFDQSKINNTYMCDYQDLTPLFKTIGLYISLLGSKNDDKKVRGLQEVSSARLIDGSDHITRYITIGLSLVQYPKALLEEYVSIDFAKKIINDWIDDTKYGDKKVKIKRIAEKNTEDAINYILDNDLNDIPHDNTPSMDAYIKILSMKLLKKTYQPYSSAGELIFNNFNSEGKTNIYQQIKDKLFIARDTYIQRITNDFYKLLKAFPNLSIAKLFLNGVADHLNELFDFWKKEYGFDENTASWNNLLGEFISNLSKNTTGIQLMGLTKEYYQEQLQNLLRLLKLHLLIEELKIIIFHIINPTNPLKTKNEGQILPSVAQLNKYSEKLSNIIDNSNNNIAFTKRSNSIISMSKSYGMIFNIYPKGDFESEIRSLKSTVDLKKIISQDIVLKDKNLWQFLGNNNSLYFDILSPIVSKISGINNTDINFDKLILNDADKNIISMIRADKHDLQYAPPAFIKLDKNIGSRSIFQDSVFLKTIYLFNDVATMNNIRNSLRSSNNMPDDNLDNSSFVKQSYLKYAIGIFKSYGYFGGNQNQKTMEKSLIPTRDLAAFNNTKNQFVVNDLFTDIYLKERVPYLNQNLVKKYLYK